jgi:hypothetical protein
MPADPNVITRDKRYRQVSDHALVRYMERVLAYDLDGLRAAILEPVAAFITPKVTTLRHGDLEYLLQDGVITTIVVIPRKKSKPLQLKHSTERRRNHAQQLRKKKRS